jgi:hypothetical protein
MAAGDKPKPEEPRPTQSTPDPKGDERKYSRDELHERARSLLDVSPHVLRAALANEKAQTFTLDRARKLVTSAAKHEEKVDDHRAEAAPEAEAEAA